MLNSSDPTLVFDPARQRQRTLLCEAEQDRLAREATAGRPHLARQALVRRVALLARVVLVARRRRSAVACTTPTVTPIATAADAAPGSKVSTMEPAASQ